LGFSSEPFFEGGCVFDPPTLHGAALHFSAAYSKKLSSVVARLRG
jgi:hypothetical protein